MSGKTEHITAIKQLAADWWRGWLTGNAELLLSLFGDNPVLMPQDQPPLHGKDTIRPVYESALNEYDFESESTLVEVEAFGQPRIFLVQVCADGDTAGRRRGDQERGKVRVHREAAELAKLYP